MYKEQIHQLRVSNLIVHDVPRHLKGEDPDIKVTYSEQPSVLTRTMEGFFTKKIIEAIGADRSIEIEFEDENENENKIPATIKEMLISVNENFVEGSKILATELFKAQTGWNSSGILVVVNGKVGDVPVVVIMKLQRDEGARINRTDDDKNFDIEEVKNLMLTDNTKTYKTALFYKDQNRRNDGWINDKQVVGGSTLVANFFLHYLGCKFVQDSSIMTRSFFLESLNFLKLIDDPLKKLELYNHLTSYTNSNQDTISANEFSMNYMTKTDRDAYLAYLEVSGVKGGMFVKDTTKIKAEIRKRTYVFDNDVVITSLNGEETNNVRLSKIENSDIIKAEVKGKIIKIGK